MFWKINIKLLNEQLKIYIIRHTQPELYNTKLLSGYSPGVQSHRFNLYAVCMNLVCNVQSWQVCNVERCIY